MARRAAPVRIVWHWGTCSCGQTVYAGEDQILHEFVVAGCCGASPSNFGCAIDPAHAHPSEQCTVVCHACKLGPGAKRPARKLVSTVGGEDVWWHWFTCLQCAGPMELRADELTAEGLAACACGPARGDHPAVHALAPERVLCPSCQPTIDVPPGGAEQEESPMAAKKRAKKNGVSAPVLTSSTDPSHAVERARYHEQLPCKVDEDTTNKARDELATLIGERAMFLDRRKADNASARERRAYYDERIEELGRNIKDRVQVASVEVVEEYIAATRRVQVRRLDTGEIVSSRPANDDDAQEELALEEEAAIARAEDSAPDGPRTGDIEAPADVLAGRARAHVSGTDAADLFPEP